MRTEFHNVASVANKIGDLCVFLLLAPPGPGKTHSPSANGAIHKEPGASPLEENPQQIRVLKGRSNGACLPGNKIFMPQSLARLHIHLVFSTKNRAPLIHDGVRDSLHRYMAVVMKNKKCSPMLINSVEDHIHLLFELDRTVSMSEIVEEVKTSSSKWLKTQGVPDFAWQKGYGAFAVSASHVAGTKHYIAAQQEHHRKRSFMEEYREFLEQNGIRFDERYVWD